VVKETINWVRQLRRLYVGFAVGVIFVTLAVSWQEVTALNKIIYIILFLGLLTAATWPKQKPHNSDNNADNNPCNIMERKIGHKSSNSPTEGKY
jgi:hypothetical protein